MSFQQLRRTPLFATLAIGTVCLVTLVVVLTRESWFSLLPGSLTESMVKLGPSESDSGHAHHTGGHAPHQHADEGDDTIELSAAACRNIRLQTTKVTLQEFVRTVNVPAKVVERPGRSQVEVTAPLTGIVIRIHPLEGEAVMPGQPLFDLRLTHEDLVVAQREFLQSVQSLDLIKKEIARLKNAGDGVVAGRRIVDKEYEQQKLQSAVRAQSQGLLLHGLSTEQIENILESRQLLQKLTVAAPDFSQEDHFEEIEHLFHVQELYVKRGEHVAAGTKLSVLGDHCELYIEGHAFEEDASRLIRAANEGWEIVAVPAESQENQVVQASSTILYVSNHVEADSRALPFFMSLTNLLVQDTERDGHRFIGWRYRPGQRMNVRVPVELWERRIVLPREAVIEDGPEAYVFKREAENHFKRLPVHVEYRDSNWVVLQRNNSLVRRDIVIVGAYELHLELKAKAGGSVIAHHGHSH